MKRIFPLTVVPLYNEEEIIELFYARTRKVVQKYDYSFLFVDDGSTDNTLAKIQTFSMLDGRISYISFSRNFGQQNALKVGYDHSSGFDCVVSMDADLQHPPELIDALVTKWLDDFDRFLCPDGSNSQCPRCCASTCAL